MENNTAKHTVLQFGSLVTLYISISTLIVLLFSIINLQFPDSIESYWDIESASSSVRYAIAMLIVFFPTYIVLTRNVNQIRRKETNQSYLGITKWLVYLSLLVGGGVLLGNAVALILGFLEGELTTRFLLKSATLFVVVGAAFYYYLQDARGYWMTKEKESKLFGVAMATVVLVSMVLGFTYTETPAEVRELKTDAQQIQDLQQIQWRIEEVININGTSSLPVTLDVVYNTGVIPEAPEGREAYSYEVTEDGFALCATFSADSTANVDMWGPSFDTTRPIKNADNWSYEKGRYCFERVVR